MEIISLSTGSSIGIIIWLGGKSSFPHHSFSKIFVSFLWQFRELMTQWEPVITFRASEFKTPFFLFFFLFFFSPPFPISHSGYLFLSFHFIMTPNFDPLPSQSILDTTFFIYSKVWKVDKHLWCYSQGIFAHEEEQNPLTENIKILWVQCFSNYRLHFKGTNLVALDYHSFILLCLITCYLVY